MMTRLSRLIGDRRGATAIEYCLIVALIALAMAGALGSLGGGVGGMWTDMSREVVNAV